MKIVPIFAPNLFAFQFADEHENELQKVYELWNDPELLTEFLLANKSDWPRGKTLNQLRDEIQENAEKFEDKIKEYSEKQNPRLDELFVPLINSEFRTVLLSKRKGKNSKKEDYLRIYALKIESNLYVITGGAIKFTHLMEERKHTDYELKKLERFRNFLKENGVSDEEGFYDFLLE
jgi:hypothetical protein